MSAPPRPPPSGPRPLGEFVPATGTRSPSGWGQQPRCRRKFRLGADSACLRYESVPSIRPPPGGDDRLLGAERYHFGSEVAAIEQDGAAATVILADGSRSSGELGLGGDDIHSIVRDRVLGQEVELERSRYW